MFCFYEGREGSFQLLFLNIEMNLIFLTICTENVDHYVDDLIHHSLIIKVNIILPHRLKRFYWIY